MNQGGEVSDAPSKSLQNRMRYQFVDELLQIEGHFLIFLVANLFVSHIVSSSKGRTTTEIFKDFST